MSMSMELSMPMSVIAKAFLSTGSCKNCLYVFSLLLAGCCCLYMHVYTVRTHDSTMLTVFCLQEASFSAVSSYHEKIKAASRQDNRLCDAHASMIECSCTSCSRANFRISPFNTKWGGRAVGTIQMQYHVARLSRHCCRTLGQAFGVSIWLDR